MAKDGISEGKVGQLPLGGGFTGKSSIVSLPNHVQHLPSFPLRGRKSMARFIAFSVKGMLSWKGHEASAQAEESRNIPRNAVQ